MSILNVSEYSRQAYAEGQFAPVALQPEVAAEDVTISGTSAQSSAFDSDTRLVRLVSDVACYVKFGTNPTAAAGDVSLPAGVVEYHGVPVGEGYKIAVIAA